MDGLRVEYLVFGLVKDDLENDFSSHSTTRLLFHWTGTVSTVNLHIKIRKGPHAVKESNGRQSGARVTMHVGYPHRGHCPASETRENPGHRDLTPRTNLVNLPFSKCKT